MTTDPKDKKIADLESQIKSLNQKIVGLIKAVSFLERENARRKSDINQITTAVNRKG